MTTVASASTWLAAHIGKHRLIVLDATHVRCIDCQQNGVLGHTSPDPTDPRSALTLPQPGTGPVRRPRDVPNLRDPNACPLHPGQWTDSCGPCRSEVLALPDRVPTVQPDPTTHADPRQNPDWLAMREQLANRKETR